MIAPSLVEEFIPGLGKPGGGARPGRNLAVLEGDPQQLPYQTWRGPRGNRPSVGANALAHLPWTPQGEAPPLRGAGETGI